MIIRGFYDYDMDAVSRETGLRCEDKSLAVQSMKDEADINILVKRFGLTGVIPQNVRVPLLNDFDEVFDFQSAQNAIVSARESFMSLNADVRERFQNDPAKFVIFCDDPKNLDQLREWGMAVPKEEPPPPVVTPG